MVAMAKEPMDAIRKVNADLAKRARLQREILKAAIVWHGNDKGFTRIALRFAVQALLEFEKEHPTS